MLVMWRTAFAPVAIPVIQVMGRYDQYNSRNYEVAFNAVIKLLGDQKKETKSKKRYR